MMKSSTLRCSFGSIQSLGLNLPSALAPRGMKQRDLAGEIADLELFDAARAVGAGEQRLPRRLDAAADGRDDA